MTKTSRGMTPARFAAIKKPSRLLATALAELDRCEKAKDVVVDMRFWCEVRDDKCLVCLAGAVMRSVVSPASLSLHRNRSFRPSCFEGPVRLRLLALDCLRQGLVATALGALNCEARENYPEDFSPPFYESDRKGWWQAMRKLVKDLRAAGL